MGKHTNGYHGPTNSPADHDPDHDEVYDALADLFLSDHPAGSAMDRRETPAVDDDFDDAPEVEGVATLKYVGEQAVNGSIRPAPVVERPAPTHTAQAIPMPAAPPRPAFGAPAQTPCVRLEMLVLGHLPVMASAWATQYAQSIVDAEAQPVACLRLASGYASLDVFGIGRQMEPAATIDAAIARAAKLTNRWVIRADAPSEPALALRTEITDVTLLVGADEAAVVAAYRTIKGLVATGGAIAEDAGRQCLRVAVMGASDEQADIAYTKIAHTVEVYLGQPVERAASVEKVRPAPSATLFRGPIEDTGAMLIDQLLNVLDSPETLLPTHDHPLDDAAPASAETPERRIIHEPTGRDDQHDDRRDDRPEAEVDESSERPVLATQLDGLAPLRARCPFEPLVELAYDHDGRLHLLEHTDHATVSSLLTAASWAAQHAELIGLTLGAGGRVRSGVTPTMHVFTDRPSDVRRLLDTEVRVHLLSNVDVGDRSAWCCTDLN